MRHSRRGNGVQSLGTVSACRTRGENLRLISHEDLAKTAQRGGTLANMIKVEKGAYEGAL